MIQKIIERLEIFVNKNEPPTLNDVKECLNCVRLLTRIFPFVFEYPEFEKFLWIEDNLALKVVTITSSLLFYRGLTIPTNPQSPNIRFVIWSKGIGATTAPPSSRDEIYNRIDVMRLLVVLLSKTMYTANNTPESRENPWTLAFTSQLDKKSVLGMLCSFINTISEYDPIGWATLPYNHFLVGDVVEPLVSLCCQALVCLLDFGSEIEREESVIERQESIGSLSGSTPDLMATSSTAGPINLFTHYFSKLHKQHDLEVFVGGISRLLLNPIEASRAFLPGSAKSVNLTTELLLLLWVGMYCNKNVISYLCQSPNALVVLQALINVSLEARVDPSKYY